jgi:hypothetical protein
VAVMPPTFRASFQPPLLRQRGRRGKTSIECRTLRAHRLHGEPVAIKCADTCNSASVVELLQHEAVVLSGKASLHTCGEGLPATPELSTAPGLLTPWLPHP